MATSSTEPQPLRVLSFESRRGTQMAELIARQGGQPLVVSAMREVPLEGNHSVVAFAEKLLRREINALIFLTGPGTSTLLEILLTLAPKEQILAAFQNLKLLSRGPKPAEALHQWESSLAVTLCDPGTWRDVLARLDDEGTWHGKTIAIQEYGTPNQELVDGLVERGAKVLRVPVYRWSLPENLAPLRQALRTVIDGKADVVLFTNSNQIQNVIQLAQEEGLEKDFLDGLARTVVASVGPVCSEFLDEYGVPVDIQPEQPKMADLVQEATLRGPQLLEQKRRAPVLPSSRAPVTAKPQEHGRTGALENSPFMKACRREPTPFTPIWLMRQAGRYMKEYRDIRDRHSFLDLCKDSDLTTEVTVYAAQRLGVDAAIIFSDILVVVEPMGMKLEYAKGDGPLIHNPVRSAADIGRLSSVKDGSGLEFVYEAIRKTRSALPPDLPLIGFAGAPFTLASYMIEGKGSRNFIFTKSMMYEDPDAWHRLMTKITDTLIGYLNAQVAAGAQVIQLFDSWVGCLSPDDYRAFVLPHSRRVIQNIKSGVPVIHFGTDTATLLELLRAAGGNVIGVDWRIELDQAWKRLGDVAIQGNLDPTVLFSSPAEIRRQAKKILDQAAGKSGHIFNLGHGVLPNTPVGHVKALVDYVHEASQKGSLRGGHP